jgi:tripartite-type tricarboxylate transporter receptor subunit TctC
MSWYRTAAVVLLTGLTYIFPVQVQAQFPDRPLKLIVPFPAGDTADTLARVLGNKVSEKLGQKIVIENVGGAHGIPAVTKFLQEPADGYAVYMSTTTSFALVPNLKTDITYSPVKDFEPLTNVAKASWLLCINAGLPVANVKELVKYVNSNPGKTSFGFSSAATRIAGEKFKREASLDISAVPYRGGQQVMVDLLGGQIQVAFLNPAVATPHIKAGRLKALAIANETRSKLAPDVPTMIESGYPGFLVDAWYALHTHAKAPPENAKKLAEAFSAALRDPSVSDKFTDLGLEVTPSTQQELRSFVSSEIGRWGKLAQQTGVTLD